MLKKDINVNDIKIKNYFVSEKSETDDSDNPITFTDKIIDNIMKGIVDIRGEIVHSKEKFSSLRFQGDGVEHSNESQPTETNYSSLENKLINITFRLGELLEEIQSFNNNFRI